MEKGVFVKDIVPNAPAEGIFVVESANMAQSRNGPYWRLSLKDATGSIDAFIWSPSSSRFERIETGKLARAKGKTGTWNDRLQFTLNDLSILSDDEADRLDLADFMPASAVRPEIMLEELKNLCESEFTLESLRTLARLLLDDERIARPFRLWPAARHIHHAYAGGLLEHTLGVFRLCQSICDNYPELDRQILLAGALLHDLGKIREFSGGFANDYTDRGRLMGHLFLGLEMIEPYLVASGLEAPLKEHLKHLILSHHGELAYGAIRLPQTAEAFALHYADNLDAKLAQCRALLRDADPGQWSEWQKSLDRSICKPCQTSGWQLAPEARGEEDGF